MTDLLPVLLGADLNCFHLARSFYEDYGVRAVVFGKRPLSQTKGSRFLDFYALPEIEKDEVLLKALRELVLRTPEKKRILLGCTDAYVHQIASLHDALDEDFILPYDEPKKLSRFDDKCSFATLCARHGIRVPQTVMRYPYAPLPPLPFAYPIILKPAQSALYWEHPFCGMQKVYLCDSAQHAQQILDQLDRAGYGGRTLLQEYIPGQDFHSYVLHGYSDRSGRVRAMALGRVLCEEHTPRGRGNPAAVLTVPCDGLCEKIKTLLEKERFVGFFNLDIKEDCRTGERFVLECNPRQGRCAFFAQAAGLSLARSMVEDRVLRLPYRGCVYAQSGYYWRYLPERIVRRELGADRYALCEAAKQAGRAVHSYDSRFDLAKNPLRRLWVWAHQARFFSKYRLYRSLQVYVDRGAERADVERSARSEAVQ